MVNHLRAFAKTYKEGNVTFYIHPARPIRVGVYVEAFESAGIPMNKTLLNFLTVEPATVDLEFEGTLTEDEQQLQAYWLSRNGDPISNYDMYTLLSLEMINAWIEAYNATRSTVVKASEILQEGDPDKQTSPLDGSDGKANGQSKS